MKSFTYHNPQKLIFGENAFEQLATLPMPGKKALIVVTPERLFVDKAQSLLKKNGVESVVFDQVRPNPNYQSVDKAAAFALKEKCDFLVSIGGGSATDTAKGVSVVMGSGGSADDYIQKPTGAKAEITNTVPLVVVSTTSGTGTEADQGAVIANDEEGLKLHLGDDRLYAVYSIVDPLLQVSLPKFLTAVQGMDAVFHAMEAYLNKLANPYSDTFALKSIEYAKNSLKRAYQDGNDVEARAGMAIASNMAGICESQVDVISLHALGHTFGSLYHTIPHGVSMCLVAVEWLKHYKNIAPERFSDLSQAVGHGKDPEGLIDFIADLLQFMELDKIDYSKYGIEYSRAAEYAKHSLTEIALYHQSDLRVMTMEECTAIYEKSLKR